MPSNCAECLFHECETPCVAARASRTSVSPVHGNSGGLLFKAVDSVPHYELFDPHPSPKSCSGGGTVHDLAKRNPAGKVDRNSRTDGNLIWEFEAQAGLRHIDHPGKHAVVGWACQDGAQIYWNTRLGPGCSLRAVNTPHRNSKAATRLLLA